MADKIENEYKRELLNDEPIELVKGLFLYPVTMRDYYEFMLFSLILNIKKNQYDDVEIISMSYLEFILYLISLDNELSPSYSSALYFLISLVTRIKAPTIHYGKGEDGKVFISISDENEQECKEFILKKKDFDRFKEIVMVQNIPDYKDEYINPELEKELERANNIRNKGRSSCGIEKKEISVVINTSLTLEEVKNMTIRKFVLVLEMVDKQMHYEIYKTASLSGFVEFKNEIEHYLIEKKDSEFEKVLDYESFKGKINSV